MIYTLIITVAAVYLAAVNVYGFVLLFVQRKNELSGEGNPVKDSKLYLAAALGGAAGVYVAMFALRFRLKSLPLMVLMPVIAALYVFLVIWGLSFGSNFQNGQNFIYFFPLINLTKAF